MVRLRGGSGDVFLMSSSPKYCGSCGNYQRFVTDDIEVSEDVGVYLEDGTSWGNLYGSRDELVCVSCGRVSDFSRR